MIMVGVIVFISNSRLQQHCHCTASDEGKKTEAVENEKKRQKRALVEISVEKQLRKKIQWPRSKVRMKRAIDDYECIEHEQSLMIALRVIEEMSKGWKGGATQSTTIGDAEIRNLPVLNVAIDKKHAYEEYLKLADEDDRILGEKRLGYPSFSSLFSGVTRMTTAKHALSYYYVDALDVSSLQDMVNRLNVLWDLHHVLTSSPETYADYTNLEKENITFQTLKTALKQAEEHIKYGIRPHIRSSDIEKNWNSRFSCNKQNVKKWFAKWTKEKKTRQKEEAMKVIKGTAKKGTVISMDTIDTLSATTIGCRIDEYIVDALALDNDQSELLEDIVDMETE